jgi:hypothetical protein
LVLLPLSKRVSFLKRSMAIESSLHPFQLLELMLDGKFSCLLSFFLDVFMIPDFLHYLLE